MSPGLTAVWSAAGVTAPVLTIDTAGSVPAGVVTLAGSEAGLVTVLPATVAVPVAVAVSVTTPLSTSPWVTW